MLGACDDGARLAVLSLLALGKFDELHERFGRIGEYATPAMSILAVRILSGVKDAANAVCEVSAISLLKTCARVAPSSPKQCGKGRARYDGRMPQPIRINSRVLWDRLQLDEAFAALSDQGAIDDPWGNVAP
jgi:hypothetical protein